MKKILAIIACAFLTSCVCNKEVCKIERRFSVKTKNPTVIAHKTNAPVKIDGVIGEDEWKDTITYKMFECKSKVTTYCPPKRRATLDAHPFQGGEFKIQYDENNIYVAVKLTDTDVVHYGKEDQDMLFRSGDTIEVFLKSKKSPIHWEIYGTANGRRATLRQIGLGEYCSDLMEEFHKEVEVATTVQGTLNNFNDTDEGYIVEFKIPLSFLKETTGIAADNNGEWTVQIARYNYTFDSEKQFSAFPELPQVGYHYKEYYADLQFE